MHNENKIDLVGQLNEAINNFVEASKKLDEKNLEKRADNLRVCIEKISEEFRGGKEASLEILIEKILKEVPLKYVARLLGGFDPQVLTKAVAKRSNLSEGRKGLHLL